jgi:hypothetical protein
VQADAAVSALQEDEVKRAFPSVKIFIWAISIALIAFTVFKHLPVQAQQAQNTSPPQATGAPGSPDATITIDGKQLPAPAEKFGGVIKDNAAQSKPFWPATIVPPKGAPNVLLIMTDDVGFGAPSTFGGVIPTPNLDRIANNGLRYTQFHSTALCSPTRAALITGRNHHSVGFSGQWLKGHLKASYEPLLQEPWILDVDTTVKPLYGHQQDAKVGYNPTKPGRPSHAYHSYFAANIRMVLDMEVQAGNQTAPLFAQPELWAFLDGLSERNRPVFLRGDSHWGAEKAMLGAEQRELGYLFKLKQSANVKKLIGQIFRKEEWVEAGHSP